MTTTNKIDVSVRAHDLRTRRIDAFQLQPCEVCGNPSPGEDLSYETLIERAYSAGWRTVFLAEAQVHCCPDCAQMFRERAQQP